MNGPTPELVELRRRARALLRANGWDAKSTLRAVPQAALPSKGMPQRDSRMAEMYAAGRTLAEIGLEYNITRERVRQLLVKQGVSSVGGGASARRRSNDSKREAARVRARNNLSLSTYGCGHEQVLALNFGLPLGDMQARTHKWCRQRQSARERGIEWNLSFIEWCAIWDASGKWPESGRGKGRYCMSRYRDSGAYEIGNVKICTNEENISESYETNPSANRQKLNVSIAKRRARSVQVLEMSNAGKENFEIAEALGIKPSYVRNILVYARQRARQVNLPAEATA